MDTIPDWTTGVTLGQAIATAVFIALAIGALYKGWRIVRPGVRAVGLFLEDWAGEEARPGVRARPGVMERIARIEHEVHPNGGTSMKDAVDRIERAQGEQGVKLDEHIASSLRIIRSGKQTETELRQAVADLAEAIPIVAASTPPDDT